MDEKTLNDLLECSVCLERLDTSSKVLPCQHTFCRKCLEVIVQSHQELRCPECRILIQSKIEELPPNVLLMRILEGMKNTAHNQNNSSKSPKNLVNLQNTGLNQLANNSKLITINNQQQHLQLQQHMIRGQDDRINVSVKNPLTSIPHAKAIYDFVSKETGDLTIKAGDIIIMRKRLDHNWCIGELNGREGAFPLNHVQIIIPLPIPQCKTLYDFRMGPNEEEGCLTFKKGVVIHVIRRVDHNWAEGIIGDNIGIFPIAFVEMNSLAKHLMDASVKHIQHTNSSSRIVPPKPFDNTSSDSSSTITTSPNSSSTSNTSSNSSTAPSSPTSNLLNNTGTGQQNQQHNKSRDNKEKRHSLTANGSKQSSLLQTNRHSVEILNPQEPDTKTPKPSTRNTESSQSQSRTNNHKMTNYQRFQNLPAVFEAIYPYKPQNPDELELKKGSVYYVTERCEDGWLKGSNRSKKSGVFPGNYVISLSRNRVDPNTQQNSIRAPQQAHQQQQQQSGGPNIQQIPGLIHHHTNQTPHQPPELPPRNSSPSSSLAGASSISSTPVLQSIWSKPLGSVDALFNRKTSQTSSNNQIKNEKKGTSSSPITTATTSVPTTSTTTTTTINNKEKKESSTSSAVSLMKRLTNMKRSKSPTSTTTSSSTGGPYSLDNPVYDDSPTPPSSTKQPQHQQQHNQIQITHPLHVRSGSCPSQLLQSLPLDINTTIGENSQSLLYGSKRVKNQQGKERPSLQDLRSNTDAGILRNKTTLNEQINGAGPSTIKQQINNNILSSGINLNNHNHNHHQMPSSYHRKSQSLDASTISSQLIGTPSKNKTHQNIRERFICIVPYPPNSEYELELHVGDIVFVHKKRENGWYKGTGQRTGKTGLFPASFVEPDI